jgi:hypothetical protein
MEIEAEAEVPADFLNVALEATVSPVEEGETEADKQEPEVDEVNLVEEVETEADKQILAVGEVTSMAEAIELVSFQGDLVGEDVAPLDQ